MKPLLGDVLLAGTGGFLGAAVRLMSCVALSAWGGQWGYAWGTFVVNIVGSFCMGYVSPFWLSVQHPGPGICAGGRAGRVYHIFQLFGRHIAYVAGRSLRRSGPVCGGQRTAGAGGCVGRVCAARLDAKVNFL